MDPVAGQMWAKRVPFKEKRRRRTGALLTDGSTWKRWNAAARTMKQTGKRSELRDGTNPAWFLPLKHRSGCSTAVGGLPCSCLPLLKAEEWVATFVGQHSQRSLATARTENQRQENQRGIKEGRTGLGDVRESSFISEGRSLRNQI